jgi:hypothetical protein
MGWVLELSDRSGHGAEPTDMLASIVRVPRDWDAQRLPQELVGSKRNRFLCPPSLAQVRGLVDGGSHVVGCGPEG